MWRGSGVGRVTMVTVGGRAGAVDDKQLVIHVGAGGVWGGV